MNIDLDNDIDRLYIAPRDQFVRERDALVRRVRSLGDKNAAAEVAALRKPTLVAWTVNQLAHDERREVDLLLDAGKRIIDAQQESISSGGRTELDAAQTSIRKAVNELTTSAAALLGPGASTTTLTRVAETLRSAATSPEGRELLARGRLTEELSETGWEIVAGFTPAPTTKRGRGAKDAPESAAAAQRRAAAEIAAERKRLQELKKAHTAAVSMQRDARRAERAAAAQLEDLHEARTKADARLEAIEDEIAAVEQRVSELRDAG